jgi:hypothetical protein
MTILAQLCIEALIVTLSVQIRIRAGQAGHQCALACEGTARHYQLMTQRRNKEASLPSSMYKLVHRTDCRHGVNISALTAQVYTQGYLAPSDASGDLMWQLYCSGTLCAMMAPPSATSSCSC